jgi:predicted transposase YdaD
MDLQILWDALLSLVPPLLVGLIFFIVMRGIFRADATERKVYQEIEAEMRAEQEAKALSEQRDKNR